MDRRLYELGEAVLTGQRIEREDALYLISLEGPDTFHLVAYANEIRARFAGDEVELCSIINARSGGCSEDCAFCAQSAHYQTGAPVYGLLDAETIITKAKAMEAAGAKRFDLVTSGLGFTEEDPDFQRILEIYRRLREETRLELCACLGTLTPRAAKALAEAGVTRYNHNLETARSYFPQICSTHSYDERVATVLAAKEAGMEVCCGGVIGMGETREQRVELALELRELGVDSIPINILNPRPGTPLYGIEPLPPEEIIKTFAVFRFIMPDKLIRYAGGREVNLGPLQPLGLLAGLNAMLVGGYLTTAGQDLEADLAMIRVLDPYVRDTSRSKAEATSSATCQGVSATRAPAASRARTLDSNDPRSRSMIAPA